jgi:hypothetical protein
MDYLNEIVASSLDFKQVTNSEVEKAIKKRNALQAKEMTT